LEHEAKCFSSQRFWDNCHELKPDQLEQAQTAIAKQAVEVYDLCIPGSCSMTVRIMIHTWNERPHYQLLSFAMAHRGNVSGLKTCGGTLWNQLSIGLTQ
jgi:hypothetical protein